MCNAHMACLHAPQVETECVRAAGAAGGAVPNPQALSVIVLPGHRPAVQECQGESNKRENKQEHCALQAE